MRYACLAALLALPGTVFAQYQLAPSPVLDIHALTPDVRLGGYVSVRSTERRDTVTFIVNHPNISAL